jgi:phosphoglycerate dehydrogenase-like enzyme
MIRILITDPLPGQIIDQLNEIPEFEVVERSASPVERPIAEDIRDADAVITPATTSWPPTALENAVNLKVIVLTGAGPAAPAAPLAGGKNITVRRIHGSPPPGRKSRGGTRELRESEVIAILKDFFNV